MVDRNAVLDEALAAAREALRGMEMAAAHINLFGRLSEAYSASGHAVQQAIDKLRIVPDQPATEAKDAYPPRPSKPPDHWPMG